MPRLSKKKAELDLEFIKNIQLYDVDFTRREVKNCQSHESLEDKRMISPCTTLLSALLTARKATAINHRNEREFYE